MRKVTDKFLENHAPFRRFPSFSDAGINMSQFILSDKERKGIHESTKFYREKFIRLMMPKFKIPARTRSDVGPFVDISEAVEGISDCFRTYKLKKRAPLRIGINLSRDYYASNIVSIRGAAILALIHLCKSRGQQVVIEACYGNGLTSPRITSSRLTSSRLTSAVVCHIRIEMPSPNIDTITRVTCSSSCIKIVGEKLIQKEDMGKLFVGIYRFNEFEKIKGWPKEHDFLLDRIETNDPKTEERRVIEQLEKFSLI